MHLQETFFVDSPPPPHRPDATLAARELQQLVASSTVLGEAPPKPEYSQIEDRGPQASSRFLFGVSLVGHVLASARGRNKKMATTAAAELALPIVEGLIAAEQQRQGQQGAGAGIRWEHLHWTGAAWSLAPP